MRKALGRPSWRVERRFDPVFREAIVRAVRPGFPTLLFAPCRGTLQKFALVAVDCGAADLVLGAGVRRRELPAGTAHFLEHQLFEGESANAFDFFAKLGASANAYTDYGETAYHVSCVDRFPEALAHLLRFVRAPHFTQDTVEKEKGIIAEEIRMYRDDPDSACLQILHEALFARHPARLDIAGTFASIRRVTPATLYEAYWAFYHPARMVVVVAADIPLGAVLAILEKTCAEAPAGHPRPWRPARRRSVSEPSRVARRWVRRHLAIPLPKLLIAFKEGATGLRGVPLLRQRFSTAFLGDLLFGPGSLFHQEAAAGGLIDEDFGFGYQGDFDFGYSLAGGRTRDPARLRAALLRAVERAGREGISSDDFERIRTKMLGGFLKTFHSPPALGRTLGGCHRAGIHLFDHARALAALKPADLVRRLAEHFRVDRSATVVAGH